MRKFFWQRWALIFMLMSRLVIGELGHAMPVAHSMDRATHPQMSQPLPSATANPAACPDHEGSKSQMPAADDPSSENSSGEQDCCKSGACECPCLHVPCASLDTFVLKPLATTLLLPPQDAEGVVSQRPSGLFRPPA